MKILFFGDIVGKPGRLALSQVLPDLKNKYQPDFIIVNGENATHGKGIGLNAYNFIQELGVDCITGGDHIFDIIETTEILNDPKSILIRPANFPDSDDLPGSGYKILTGKSGSLGVINLQGRVFMREGTDNPFHKIDELLKQKDLKDIPVFVDFHTEATSEIAAMGWYLDGRVSAVVGTHTHIQTNDARILPKGTGFISDVGMCGPKDSILGVDKNIIIKKFLTGLPNKHEVAEGSVVVNFVVIETKDKKAVSITPVSQIVE